MHTAGHVTTQLARKTQPNQTQQPTKPKFQEMAESTVQLTVAANKALPGKFSLSNFVYVSPNDFKRVCQVGSPSDNETTEKYGVLMTTKGFVFNVR